GAFTIRNSVFDVYSVAILGVVAYGLIKARIPITPIILGVVLGPALERDFRTALILSDNDVSVFWSSFPSILFMGLALLVVGTQIVASVRSTIAERNSRNSPDASVKPGQ